MIGNKQVKKVVVIGDKLNDFSSHKNAIRMSDLENLVSSSLATQPEKKYAIYLGQGVNEERLKNLHAYIVRTGLTDTFQLHFPSSYQKSDGCLTHKKKSQNIMISEPTLNGETYESHLVLDDDCAEMSDHITGQHIQGMVLVEAARQMVIAVTEKFFINKDINSKVSFVTHSMDTKFHEFVFPLAISIKYKILEMRRAYKNNLSSKVLISFIQNDVVSAEVIFHFSALDAKFLVEKESNLADAYINSYLNAVNQ